VTELIAKTCAGGKKMWPFEIRLFILCVMLFSVVLIVFCCVLV
jgi:hypothetical protein